VPLDIDTQLAVLADQIRKADASNVELRDKVMEYLRTYGDLASPEALGQVHDAIYRKYGIVAGAMPPPAPSEDVFPKRGWLREYLTYTARHEAPDLFHFWVGVAVICGAVRRNIYFEQGYYRVYPNFYVVLVAPPGACKKSTATNIGVELLGNVPGVNIIREKITPEGLIVNLHENIKLQTKSGGTVLEPSATGFIHAPELAVFLGRQTYNEGIIALLTSLFDCHTKWEYTTRGSGRLTLHNIHITILGATTPDLLTQVIPDSAFGGGFLSRVLFVVRESTDRCEPFPVIRDPLERERLLAKLVAMSAVTGQVVQSDAARAWCVEWYSTQRRQAQDDIALSGYYERKQEHLIKLCMVLLLSYGEELVITPEIYQQALNILNYTEMTMADAFTHVQTTAVGRDHERILRQLASAGGRLRHSELLKRNYGYLSADGFRKAIATLREAGLITEITGKTHEYILLHRR